MRHLLEGKGSERSVDLQGRRVFNPYGFAFLNDRLCDPTTCGSAALLPSLAVFAREWIFVWAWTALRHGHSCDWARARCLCRMPSNIARMDGVFL